MIVRVTAMGGCQEKVGSFFIAWMYGSLSSADCVQPAMPKTSGSQHAPPCHPER